MTPSSYNATQTARHNSSQPSLEVDLELPYKSVHALRSSTSHQNIYHPHESKEHIANFLLQNSCLSQQMTTNSATKSNGAPQDPYNRETTLFS